MWHVWGQERRIQGFGEGGRDGKRSLVRSRRRWKDNIKMDFSRKNMGDMDWIDLVQDSRRWRALVNAVINLRAP
jgi:hypothetical protein